MNFETLDINICRFETSLGQVIPPDLYLMVRTDGRSFTRLTKEICEFEAPSGIRFRDAMTDTMKHPMECGFRIVYGYTQNNETSLLFHLGDRTLGRKTRKINSVLVGEVNIFFSLKPGVLACFDYRVAPLPNLECVRDYFARRQEDAHRNLLNAHCYRLLRQGGKSAQEATKEIEGEPVFFRNELLFSRNINHNDLPDWQKRGIGLYYSSYEKTGCGSIKQQRAVSVRNWIETNMGLDTGDGYTDRVVSLMRGRRQIRVGSHGSEICFGGIFLYQQTGHYGAFDWGTEQESPG